jgi:hypothetical protein
MSPYEVLGVSPDASPEEIRRAYVTLARRHHPDAGGRDEDMRRLNDAWAALSSTSRSPPPASHVRPDVETATDHTGDAEVDAEPAEPYVARAASPRLRLLDSLTLLALLAWLASAALSFLFGMLFESGPLLGFCVFSLFMAGVFVMARTLLAMGFDRTHAG